MALYNVSEQVATEMIVRSDAERSHYHYIHTKKEWADARHYDIAINTSKVGLEKSIEVILEYLKGINA